GRPPVQQPIEDRPLRALCPRVDLDPAPEASGQEWHHVQTDRDSWDAVTAGSRPRLLLLNRHGRVRRAARRILRRLEPEGRHHARRRQFPHGTAEAMHLGDDSVQGPAGLGPSIEAVRLPEVGAEQGDAALLPLQPGVWRWWLGDTFHGPRWGDLALGREA